MNVETEPPLSPEPRYARFSRRLRAMLIDWVFAVFVLFGALLAAASLRDDHLARALGVMVVLVLVLYEPVLVSVSGGTLGHHWTNLRVVDDRDGGHVSFLKAVARSVLKTLLGWYSFLTMAATRRNQAVHDLLTRSTVQIRDPAGALPHHYVTARTLLPDSTMPSRLRRAGVTALDLLLLFVLFMLGLALASQVGAMSEACLNDDHCNSTEELFGLAGAAIWLAASALCIGLGWTGRLPGARRKP
jgi:uncharacterized RDD family membrane protein YckC